MYGLPSLPSGWKLVPLEEVLADGTRNGVYKLKSFHGRGVKIVNMGELFAHPRLGSVDMRRIEVTVSELSRFELKTGDLLFARRSLVAEGAGKCSIVLRVDEPTVFESSIIRARLSNEADPLFFYYFFGSRFGAAALDSIRRQVAVAGITGADLRGLRVPIPPTRVQREIAAVLGALDDKIDLNRRMNEALFATVVADIEEGGRAMFGDIADNVREIANPGDIQAETVYIALEHMPRRSITLAEWSGANSVASAKSRFQRGDILFGKLRPYFHKVGIAPGDGVCSTDILVLRPKHRELHALTLGIASSDAFVAHADATSTGTKMPRASWKDLARFEMAMPSSEALDRVNETARPLLARIAANIGESRTLAALRDALLPKLISGELRIRGAERTVAQSE